MPYTSGLTPLQQGVVNRSPLLQQLGSYLQPAEQSLLGSGIQPVSAVPTPTGIRKVNGADPSWFQRNVQYTDDAGLSHQGPLLQGMQLAMGGLEGFLGMKNYGLAKEQLRDTRNMFAAQYGQQSKLINNDMRQQQEWRNQNIKGSTPVDEYMAQYGLNERYA